MAQPRHPRIVASSSSIIGTHGAAPTKGGRCLSLAVPGRYREYLHERPTRTGRHGAALRTSFSHKRFAMALVQACRVSSLSEATSAVMSSTETVPHLVISISRPGSEARFRSVFAQPWVGATQQGQRCGVLRCDAVGCGGIPWDAGPGRGVPC